MYNVVSIYEYELEKYSMTIGIYHQAYLVPPFVLQQILGPHLE